MVAQVASFDELDVGVVGRDLIGEAVDPIDQDTGEQEIWRDDDAFIAEFCRMAEARFDEWEGNAGIADLMPAEPDAFMQHPGDFGDVAVGVGIRRAAPDDDEAGVV